MRVVVVDLLCNSAFYCGELTRALCRAGHDAQLASPRFYLEPDYLADVPRPAWIRDLVVHASRPRALRLAVRIVEGSLNFAALLRRIRAHDYEVVHVQWVPVEGRASPFMRILRAWCDRAGALLVYTAHNAVPHDRSGLDPDALRGDLDRAHLVVAHTAHIADELRTRIGTSSPIVVIPHAPLFTSRRLPPRDEAVSRIGVSARPLVLFQGLIRPYKGLDLLAEAWPLVQAAVPTAALCIAGKVADAQSSQDLDRLRHLERVHVVDRYLRVPELLDFYAAADVVVFPYRRISQSGALMTAVGLGRPAVVTPIDGLLEQVEGLESTIVADEVSGPALARALVASLDDRERLSAAADHDRAVLATSRVGWASVATATAAAYAAGRARDG